VTTDELRNLLRAIRRPTETPGYVVPMSDVEVEGWVTIFLAMGLVVDG